MPESLDNMSHLCHVTSFFPPNPHHLPSPCPGSNHVPPPAPRCRTPQGDQRHGKRTRGMESKQEGQGTEMRGTGMHAAGLTTATPPPCQEGSKRPRDMRGVGDTCESTATSCDSTSPPHSNPHDRHVTTPDDQEHPQDHADGQNGHVTMLDGTW